MPPIAAAAALNSSLPDLAKRLTEAAGILAALLYALGMMRISGELSDLHMSTPTIIAGFEHSDILMKGVGVLMSHFSSTVIMLAAVSLFASPATLAALNRVLLDERTLKRTELALTIVVGIGLTLMARWWEGAVYALIVLGLLLIFELRSRPATRAMAMLVLLLGVLFVGVIGSYIHPPPLMDARVEREGLPTVEGSLVGKGTDGEWYIAIAQPGDTYELDIVGGSADEANRVLVEPADDEGYRTLLFQMTDVW